MPRLLSPLPETQTATKANGCIAENQGAAQDSTAGDEKSTTKALQHPELFNPTGPGLRIELDHGFFTLIDPEDEALVSGRKWGVAIAKYAGVAYARSSTGE